MKRLLETTFAGLVALSMCFAGSRATHADDPPEGPSKPSATPTGLAALVQNMIDTVLEHHHRPAGAAADDSDGRQGAATRPRLPSARWVEQPRLDGDDA